MFSQNLPVLLVKLLHERGVELGVHRGKDTAVRDGTVKNLLDSYFLRVRNRELYVHFIKEIMTHQRRKEHRRAWPWRKDHQSQ